MKETNYDLRYFAQSFLNDAGGKNNKNSSRASVVKIIRIGS